MKEVITKRVILKNIDGSYLIPYVDVIDDNLPNEFKTYSSVKIDTLLENKLSSTNIYAGDNIIISSYKDGIQISSIGGGGGDIPSEIIDTSKYYTKVESDNRFATKASEHNHANKDTIDKFTEDASGVLKYNGKVVPVNPRQYEVTTEFNNSTTTEIFNIRTICQEESYKALINSYIIVKNLADITTDLEEDQEDPNTAELQIYNDNITLDSFKIPPLQVQSFQLPSILGINIKSKGNISATLVLVGYCY